MTTAGAYFAVVSVIIGSDPEWSHSSVIVALEPELSHLGSQDAVSLFSCWFEKPDLGLLWRGIRGIVCG